jgi:hypothetical protein
MPNLPPFKIVARTVDLLFINPGGQAVPAVDVLTVL